MTGNLGSNLTARQQTILMAVVSEYIATAQPVPSRTVQAKGRLTESRATIRNEMAQMERLGYLSKPHTSAGRVPTESAFRLYVSRLGAAPLGLSREHTWVHGELSRCAADLGLLLRTSTRLLADMTEQAALVSEPIDPAERFSRFTLTPVSARTIRATYETARGVRRELIWEPPMPLRSDQITALSQALAAALCRQGLGTVDAEALAAEVGLPTETVSGLLRRLAECGDQRVYVEGAAHLFNYPEFRGQDRLQAVLAALTQEGPPRALLDGVLRRAGTTVLIGSDLGAWGFCGCSLVAGTYLGPRARQGAVAVLGPMRMPYARALSAVCCVAHEIGTLLAETEHEEEG